MAASDGQKCHDCELRWTVGLEGWKGVRYKIDGKAIVVIYCPEHGKRFEETKGE